MSNRFVQPHSAAVSDIAIGSLSAFVSLVPIWASPVLVTTDGPSHVYNAFVSRAARLEQEPFASYLTVAEGLRPNRAADLLLAQLGPIVGWELAERALLTTIVAASLAIFLVLLREPSGPVFSSLTPIAAWAAQSWFTWMGFYDFSLSVCIFAALALVMERGSGFLRHLLIQVLLGLLYLAHLFTFAVAVGFIFVVFAWRALGNRGHWLNLAAAGPGLVVLVLELAWRARIGEGFSGVGFAKPIAALILGDFIVSFHPIDIVVGVLVMAAVWGTVLLRAHSARAEECFTLTGSEVFAVLLLAASIVVPFGFGEGSYIPARMRFLGTILLLPTITATLPSAFPALVSWAGIGCLLALVTHGSWIIYVSRSVNRDLHTIEQLLTKAGAQPGSWVYTKLSDHERGLFRISGYLHLSARASLRQRLVVLDNYEAYLHIFPVKWKQIPDRLVFQPVGHCWSLSVAPGDIRWPGTLLVVHENDRCFVVEKDNLKRGPTFRSGEFAVTPVRHQAGNVLKERTDGRS